MECIQDSVFDLFKIGPGPSSSHTMAPMRAGLDFLRQLQAAPTSMLRRAASIRVRLYGSLSATGRGHQTDRAVLAGLLGHAPETCPPALLPGLDREPRPLPGLLSQVSNGLRVGLDSVDFQDPQQLTPHPNTMDIRLLDAEGGVLLQREYVSPGGGYLRTADAPEPERPEPPHPYASMAGLKDLLRERGMRLHRLLRENEMAISGLDRRQVEARLDAVLDAMQDSVDRGLAASGPLPGPLGLHRKARALYTRSPEARHEADRLLLTLSACALAAAEENAAGHTIVTAPTAGSAGVLPAALHVLREHLGLERAALRRGLLAAAAVGFLARHRASISGAEVGCQGEIGVASSMAAALLAYATGRRVRVSENAAQSALEHHLGLTCDPVGGYVQIPCIERNAMGAAKAYTAYLIACAEKPAHHVVGLDRTLQAMAATGRDMCPKYKETGLGGLAAC
jgi:L-serine dehydratase